MTLRDDLAAVLGPGSDDRIAYAQADAVLEVLLKVPGTELGGEIAVAIDDARFGPWPPGSTP